MIKTFPPKICYSNHSNLSSVHKSYRYSNTIDTFLALKSQINSRALKATVDGLHRLELRAI